MYACATRSNSTQCAVLLRFAIKFEINWWLFEDLSCGSRRRRFASFFVLLFRLLACAFSRRLFSHAQIFFLFREMSLTTTITLSEAREYMIVSRSYMYDEYDGDD